MRAHPASFGWVLIAIVLTWLVIAWAVISTTRAITSRSPEIAYALGSLVADFKKGAAQ